MQPHPLRPALRAPPLLHADAAPSRRRERASRAAAEEREAAIISSEALVRAATERAARACAAATRAPCAPARPHAPDPPPRAPVIGGACGEAASGELDAAHSSLASLEGTDRAAGGVGGSLGEQLASLEEARAGESERRRCAAGCMRRARRDGTMPVPIASPELWALASGAGRRKWNLLRGPPRRARARPGQSARRRSCPRRATAAGACELPQSRESAERQRGSRGE